MDKINAILGLSAESPATSDLPHHRTCKCNLTRHRIFEQAVLQDVGCDETESGTRGRGIPVGHGSAGLRFKQRH